MGFVRISADKQHNNNNVCRRCQDQECCKAQGPRCPPQVLRDDRRRHRCPEVHLRQLQGGRCQSWTAPPHGPEGWNQEGNTEDGQEGRQAQEARSQEGRQAQEGCQETCCQEGRKEACRKETCSKEACCQESCQEVRG